MLKKSIFGFITLIVGVMMVLSFTACSTDAADDDAQTVTYSGISGGITYTLKITENTSRYVAEVGDTYVLTAGEDVSSGTVTASSPDLILEPTNAPGVPFTVTVAGTNLSTMVGTITWENGKAVTVNITSFTPVTPPGGDPVNPFEDEYLDADFPSLNGAEDFIGTTWKGNQDNTLTFNSNGTWTQKLWVGSLSSTVGTGRYLVSGNTVYIYWHETEDGPAYYYFNGYGIKTGNSIAMYGGMTYVGGDTWTKQ